MRGQAEVCADSQRAAVDAGFDFTFEEGISSGSRRAEFPAVVEIVPSLALLEACHGCLDGGFGGVDAGGAQELEGEEGCGPERLIGYGPCAIGLLAGENFAAKAFAGYAGALGGDDGGWGVGEIAHCLPADGRVGVEQPDESVHGVILADGICFLDSALCEDNMRWREVRLSGLIVSCVRYD